MSQRSWRRRWPGATLIALVLGTGHVRAQNTTVTCPPSLEWSENDLGQNPCLVGAYLLAACQTDPHTVVITPDIPRWRPGDGLSADLCSCSTVTYALIATCSICAGTSSLMQWSAWRGACKDDMVSLRLIPFNVPSGTAIPTWAFQNVELTNVFDPTTAYNIVQNGEPDAAAPSTTAVASDGEIVTEEVPAPGSTTEKSRTREMPVGSNASEVVTVSASTHKPLTTPTTETTPPDVPTDSPVPVIAGVIGALAGLCAVVSALACIIRRKGYLRPRGRRRPVAIPALSPDASEKPGTPLSSSLGSASPKNVAKPSPA